MGFRGTLVMLGLALGAGSVHASSFLNGTEVWVAHRAEYNSFEQSSTKVVGPGAEAVFRYFSVDVFDTGFKLTFRETATYHNVGGQFNGFLLQNQSNNVASFGSAVVVPGGTTLEAFDVGRIKISEDQVAVDFKGMTIAVGQVLEVQLAPVPELSTWAMFGVGLSALLAFRGRVKRLDA